MRPGSFVGVVPVSLVRLTVLALLFFENCTTGGRWPVNGRPRSVGYLAMRPLGWTS